MASARSPILRVRVLGPIQVVGAGGHDLTPDGSLQRRLLALLVLRRGLTVSSDAAVDVLWPVDPPQDPVAALHNHVSRLRRSLPDQTITSTAAGYGLEPSAIELDAERLADLVHAGSALDDAGRASLRELLDGWHGPPYPELEDVDAARAEITRLEELRQLGFETLAEARLAAGDLDGLVADLAALVEEAPLRERPRALLMEALARSGRTAEALRAYDDFRRLLGDELGIEPSPALRARHDALLVAEVAVTTAAPSAPTAGRPGPRASRPPAPVTSLVGRDDLVTELTTTIGGHRVVTLLGPGGVGKTRLLGEIGRRLEPGGQAMVWCELAAASEESAVDAVADALDVEGRPDVGLDERVAAAIGDAAVTLLLDNCEHVLHPVAALAERLLAECPNLSLVATSRERLRVTGERVCPIPPLALTSATTAGPSPAAELFTERARAVAPGFDPDPAEQATIADIVRRLDGLPLAIELAAARLLTHDVDEVASGLDDPLPLLSAGIRSSTRQGSLAAAIGWSYDLLEREQQQVFADLSVFAGPFTADTARAVCTPIGQPTASILDQLVERSLLLRAPGRRYVLLETLKAFGAEQLAASGRLDAVGRRHAEHFAAGAEAADFALLDPARPAMTEIDEALPELRTAFGWLLEHGEVVRAGELVIGLLDYGVFRLRPDVLAWAERVAAADPDDRSPVAPDVWAVSGYVAWMAGSLTDAAKCAARAMTAVERSAGAAMTAEVAMLHGSLDLFVGRLGEAADWFARSAELTGVDAGQRVQALGARSLALGYQGSAAVDDTVAELLALAGEQPTPYAAYAWYCAGEAVLATDVDLARSRLLRAVELAEVTHTSFVTGIAGATLASIVARSGDTVAAAADYKRLVAHWRRAEMWPTQWTMLRTIAGVLADLGQAADAAVLVGAVQATDAGHQIFGGDEQALAELATRLEASLGTDAFEEARRRGAAMDGDAAVDHALSSL